MKKIMTTSQLPNCTAQQLSALMNARQQRSADRAVQPRTAWGALQLLTQQSQRAIVELLALPVSSQLRQKGAE